MDAETGEFLYEKNADERLIPASLTKVMTLYLAFDALKAGQVKLDEEVTISKKAWKMGGSQMFIEVGQRVRFDDLLKGIAVVSGNDACVAVAEAIAGSEPVFVNSMNEKAKALGLANTHFMNPDGLPDKDHYSTARDMAVLAFRYLKDHPESLNYHSMKEFTYGGITQSNRNGLLFKDSSVDGIKTGWVKESGYHLIATAKKENQRLIAVVMGAEKEKQREEDALALLYYGFRNFSTVKYCSKGQKQGQIPVLKGKVDWVSVECTQDDIITLPKNKEKAFTLKKQIPENLTAPIMKGQKVGMLTLVLDGKDLRKGDLVASESVPLAGFGKRFFQSLVAFSFEPPYLGSIIFFAVVALLILITILSSRSRNRGYRYR
jgi:D-alanyl-D-alanine carboxypeptidase (penicillin-binding protein 5/6)